MMLSLLLDLVKLMKQSAKKKATNTLLNFYAPFRKSTKKMPLCIVKHCNPNEK